MSRVSQPTPRQRPRADVLVVGDGIIGLATALAVARAGGTCRVLGRTITGAASSASAGLLAPSIGAAPPSIRAFMRAARDRYPDWVHWLAERTGVYHMSAGGHTTWYEFARAIVGEGTRARIIPITTAQYPTPSRRPAYGVLNTGKFERTFGLTLPHWQTALQSCVTSPAEPPNSPAVG